VMAFLNADRLARDVAKINDGSRSKRRSRSAPATPSKRKTPRTRACWRCTTNTCWVRNRRPAWFRYPPLRRPLPSRSRRQQKSGPSATSFFDSSQIKGCSQCGQPFLFARKSLRPRLHSALRHFVSLKPQGPTIFRILRAPNCLSLCWVRLVAGESHFKAKRVAISRCWA
jgi:hypothetical protein